MSDLSVAAQRNEWPKRYLRSIGAAIEYKMFRSEADVEPGWTQAVDGAPVQTQVTDRNWPSFRYPPGGDPSSGQIFNSADDVPDGWIDRPSVPAPEPVIHIKSDRKQSDSEAQADAQRFMREAQQSAEDLRKANVQVENLGARNKQLEDFLGGLLADDGAPDALKAAIASLLDPTPLDSKKRKAKS